MTSLPLVVYTLAHDMGFGIHFPTSGDLEDGKPDIVKIFDGDDLRYVGTVAQTIAYLRGLQAKCPYDCEHCATCDR